MASQPVMAITGPSLPPHALDQISEFTREIRQLPGDLSIPDLVAKLDGVDFYVLGGNEYLDDDFFRTAPASIRQICFLGTGYAGFINIAAMKQTTISLSYTPHGNARSTAEFAFALALAGTRDLIGLAGRAKVGAWALSAQRSLFRSTLGVVGFGHVGREFTRLVRTAFDTEVLVWNRSNRDEEIRQLGATPSALIEVMSCCDVVSVHADWPTDSSEYLIGAEELKSAMRHMVLVNTGRAITVDPKALRPFLEDNSDARALFDGYYIEPMSRETDPHELLKLPNFLVTPHAAYLTDESNATMAEMLIENLRALIDDVPAPHRVTI